MKSYTITVNGVAYEVTVEETAGCQEGRDSYHSGSYEDGDPYGFSRRWHDRFCRLRSRRCCRGRRSSGDRRLIIGNGFCEGFSSTQTIP